LVQRGEDQDLSCRPQSRQASQQPGDNCLTSPGLRPPPWPHFQRLIALGLHDAFRLFEQAPKSWSWWDYRNLAFRKNQGLRIDHILVSTTLASRVTACHIDKLPRKN
jgi:exonuclease III